MHISEKKVRYGISRITVYERKTRSMSFEKFRVKGLLKIFFYEIFFSQKILLKKT